MKTQSIEGRLPTTRRDFDKVVADLKATVFSVIRLRPVVGSAGTTEGRAMGSGFFVSPDVFLTCNHVINPKDLPHQSGDTYQLVNQNAVHTLATTEVGKTVRLYPELDLALLLLKWPKKQPYVALEYGNVPQGREIGIAGYPLPTLLSDNGKPKYDGLIYRVAKNVVTAQYTCNLQTNGGDLLPNAPVIEVNFLFVPGNSGGPIFDSETGRVCGFVQGYRAQNINQTVQKASDRLVLPTHMIREYIESLHAVYSIGIKLEHVRSQLEEFSVTL